MTLLAVVPLLVLLANLVGAGLSVWLARRQWQQGRRRAAVVVVAASMFLLSVAGFTVMLNGSCLLPLQSAVPYQHGKVLCPGQTVFFPAQSDRGV
jgi:hypothetical protein